MRTAAPARDATRVVTILLVEDEPSIRQLMTTSLLAAGYRVVPAQNAVEALQLFDESITFLLTDLRMPYVTGAALIEQLRARRPALHVLAFSGYPGSPVPSGIPFLSKPFSRAQLLAAIGAVLEPR